MPEGDTVWLTARRLNQALAGAQLTVCDFRLASLATVDLRGQTVLQVLARGKHLLIRFESAITLHSHLKMDGSWYLTRAGTRAGRLPEHLIRVLLGNRDWLATGYRIHDLHLIASAEEADLVGHLGPDLLGPDWDAEQAVARLARQPERCVAEALLDQRNLAGIGNLYKSEVLFIERVNPWTPLARVANPIRLVRTAHRLMIANREFPEQSTTGLLGRGQQHWVYERNGQPCLRCRTPIRAAQQGVAPHLRTSYWCPTCQPSLA